MRQAGLKPKSHSYGTYWIRANANRAINGGQVITKDCKKTWVGHTIETIVAVVILVLVVVGFAS